ncbi:uncharacterized protein PFL1_06533 [Pseudozyma flocculosa PF-1]|uniref:Uncharacterized protein n=2 Tax=Pseudozyma flocculosa TaxID=84751 RepID=A0A5C3F852_9BASI|nr:uncharacterized protein PFL1_06533 [Pseudozyma flocculosa PF-1]EPQ25858.1 hypothetical protein PFL1_06533 [Pseudozyma flocculosa PF-1]SPO40644.1 uncharacterized protein PSFLO_06126 [Pseudozyma flocculosa]
MLLNTLATQSQLHNSPSRQDGIPEHLEYQIRLYGCQLIQGAGILLGLPQRVMATAQVLYQRFWFVSSLKHFSSRDICMGSLFLSTKLEESPVRLRDLINAFDYLIKRDRHHSRHGSAMAALATQLGPIHGQLHERREHASHQPHVYEPQGYFDNDFYEMKDALVVGEMQLLKRLGFHVQVNLPYATMVNYLQLLELSSAQVQVRLCPRGTHSASEGEGAEARPGHRRVDFAQRAWGFLNDALQTPVYCLLPPHVLACSVIYLTAQTAEPPFALPLEPMPWWELFDVQHGEIEVVCCHILRLYHSDSPSAMIRAGSGGLSALLTKKDVKEWLVNNGRAEGLL